MATSTKSRILDVAQEMMQRNGVNAVSFADISDVVGIRKASVHHHFPTKDDLTEAVLVRYHESFVSQLEEIKASKLKPPTKLKKVMALFEKTLAAENKHACLCGMLSAEIWSLNSTSQKIVGRFLSDCSNAIMEIIVEDGKCDKAKADVVLAALEGGMLISRIDGGVKRYAKMLKALEKIVWV